MINKRIIRTGIFSLITLIGIGLMGCEKANSSNYINTNTEAGKSKQVWVSLGDSFKWRHPNNHKRVKDYIKHYKTKRYHVKKLSEYASPYIYHVVSELKRQDLPGELAIIPMIESAYRPHATSCVGATGIWQLTRATALKFGIKHDKWYDGRKDIADSTKAALDYLKYLNKKYSGDWLLTLAAYNSGEPKVNRAIRKNKRAGKPIKFWDLPLPKETKQFVPKILAIAYLVKHPEEMGIKLKTVEDTPYFAKVNPKGQIDLRVAADMAEVHISEIKRLNPGYSRHLTHPKGPHKLFLPTHAVSTFNSNLNKSIVKNNVVNIVPYIVQPGDSLGKIAKKHRTTISRIKTANQLNSNRIYSGKEILIPVGRLQNNTTATTAASEKILKTS